MQTCKSKRPYVRANRSMLHTQYTIMQWKELGMFAMRGEHNNKEETKSTFKMEIHYSTSSELLLPENRDMWWEHQKGLLLLLERKGYHG